MWSQSGGTYAPINSDGSTPQVTTNDITGWYEFDVTQAVNGWLHTPSNNFGFHLLGSNTNESRFATSDNNDPSLRPVLELTYVEDLSPPVINLTSPTPNSEVSGKTTVTADVSDNEGISRVELWVGNSLRDTVYEENPVPNQVNIYSLSWDTTIDPEGSASVKIIAYDLTGNSAVSTQDSTYEETFSNRDRADLANSTGILIDTEQSRLTLQPERLELSGEISASSVMTSNYSTANLFDSDGNTSWVSAGMPAADYNQTLTLALSGTAQIQRIVLDVQSDLVAFVDLLDDQGQLLRTDGPRSLNPGLNTIDITSPPANVQSLRFTFTNLGYRTDTGIYHADVKEIKLYHDFSYTLITNPVTASAQSTLSYELQNIWDDDPDTAWISGGQTSAAASENITVDFASATDVNAIYLKPRYQGMSANIYLYQDNGSGQSYWNLIKEIPQVIEAKYDFGPQSASRLKIEFSNLQLFDASYVAAITEFEILRETYPLTGTFESIDFPVAPGQTVELNAIDSKPDGTGISYYIVDGGIIRPVYPGTTSNKATVSGSSFKVRAVLTTVNELVAPYVDGYTARTLSGATATTYTVNNIPSYNTLDPEIKITAPRYGAELGTASGNNTISGIIRSDITIDRIEVYVDGRKAHEELTPPASFSFQLDTTQLANGNHELTIRGITPSGKVYLGKYENQNVINDSFETTDQVDLSISTVNVSGGMVKLNQSSTNKIYSKRGYYSLPTDSRSYLPSFTFSTSSPVNGYYPHYWVDAGNDAFDYYGYPKVVKNGLSYFLNADGGYYYDYTSGYYVESEKLNQYTWRYRLFPYGTPARQFEMNGNMGSDYDTSGSVNSFSFNGQVINYGVNQDISGLDPNIIFAIIPSEPGDLSKVNYTWNGGIGDNTNQSAVDVSLPLTAYVAVSYHDPQTLVDAIKDNLTNVAYVSGYLYSQPIAVEPADTIKFTVSRSVPSRTSNSLSFSMDGGIHWQYVSPGVTTKVDYPGDNLILRAYLSTSDPTFTPSLYSWQADLVQARTALPFKVANAPGVYLTSPSPGTPVAGTIPVSARVIGNNMQTLEFLVDGQVQQSTAVSSTLSTYEWMWDTTTATDGPHTVTARVYDVNNLVYESVGNSQAYTLNFGDLAGSVNLAETNLVIDQTNGIVTTPSWWNTNWQYRAPVVLQNTHNLDHQGEPLMLTVTSANIAPDGVDLRVIDNENNELPFRIAEIDNDTYSYQLALESGLVAANSQETYYVYYGNPDATLPVYIEPSVMHTPVTPDSVMGEQYYSIYRNNAYFDFSDLDQANLFETISQGSSYYTGPSSHGVNFPSPITLFDVTSTNGDVWSDNRIHVTGSGTVQSQEVNNFPLYYYNSRISQLYLPTEASKPGSSKYFFENTFFSEDDTLIPVSALRFFNSGMIYNSVKFGEELSAGLHSSQSEVTHQVINQSNYIYVLQPMTIDVQPEEELPDGEVPGSGQLVTSIVNLTLEVNKVTVAVNANLPAGSQMVLEVTADNGVHWQKVTPDTPTMLANPGSALGARLYLTTNNPTNSPEVYGLSIMTSDLEINVNNSAAVPAPTNLQASASLEGVNLTWDAPGGTTPDSYAVYRSTEEGFVLSESTLVGTTTNTSYFVVAPPGVPSYYKVTARIGTAESAQSNEVAATVQEAVNTVLGTRLGLQDFWSFVQFPLQGATGYVNLATGNFVVQQDDSFVPAPGLGVTVRRTYNSHDAYNNRPLGKGWELNYNETVTLADNGATLILKEGDGSTHRLQRYEIDAQNVSHYRAPAGLYVTATLEADETFKIVRKNGVTYRFSASGQLTDISDRSGVNILLVSQSEINYLFYSEPYVRYERDAQGRITTVYDATGRRTLYTYDASGNLTAAVGAMGYQTKYAYNT